MPSSAPRSKALRVLGRMLGTLACLYFAFLFLLYIFQDRLIFYPTKMTEERWKEVAEDLHADYATIRVDAEGHHLQGWFLAGKNVMPQRPTVLFFGGNAMRAEEVIADLARLREYGANLLLVDYRGYGLSEGKPSAEFLKADAEKVFDAAASHPLVDKEKISVWGYSLGAAVASHLASVRPLQKLILFAPFTSSLDLAKEAFPFVPIQYFLRQNFDTLTLAPTLTQPTLIVTGREDSEYSSAEHAENIAAVWAGPKEVITLENRGHQDLLEDERAWEAVIEFLQTGAADGN